MLKIKGDVQSFWILHYKLSSFFYAYLCFNCYLCSCQPIYLSACFLILLFLSLKKKKNYFFLFISLFGVSCLPAVFLAGIGVQSQTMRERVSKEGMSYPNPVIHYAISEPLRQSIFSPYQFFDKCFFSSKEYAISTSVSSFTQELFRIKKKKFRLHVLLSGYFCLFLMHSTAFHEFI